MKSFIQCQNCKHWSMLPQDMNQGICRKEAPVMFPIMTQQGLQIVASQPTTTRVAGCAQGQLEVVLQ